MASYFIGIAEFYYFVRKVYLMHILWLLYIIKFAKGIYSGLIFLFINEDQVNKKVAMHSSSISSTDYRQMALYLLLLFTSSANSYLM